MKRAFQYVRISQAEQSNWSIDGQKDINLRYAERHGIEIKRTFIDDGESAKDFERPGWQALVKELSKEKHQVDCLIIAKFDRLIRNTLQGLQELQKIEQKWNVQVLSAMESYAINPDDPMFFKLRADLLVNAEFERRVISDRSKFGTWQAKLQGRHIGHAPFGYINARDDQNRPIIVMDESKKEIVIEIFQRYLNGDSGSVIRKSASVKGFHIKGNSGLTRLLSNPIYAGLIRVPSYKGEPEKLMEGLHEPMVERDTFFLVNALISAKSYPQKVSLQPEMPLRGLLLCEECGRPLTGGRSKGKKLYYWYYRCLKCSGQNHSAIHAHDQLDQILVHLSFDEETVAKIREQILVLHRKDLAGSEDKIKKLKREVIGLQSKIDALEEKYLRDAIKQDTFDKWYARYHRDLKGKENELATLEAMDDSVLDTALKSLDQMKNLRKIYHEMEVLNKQDLFKAIFPGCSIKSRKGYRTPFINPLFNHNLHKFKGLGVLEIGGKGLILPQIPICTRSGNRTR